MPLFYNIIKAFFNPFGHIPRLKDIETKPQFAKKIVKFKKENRYKFVTFWFVVKVSAFLFVGFVGGWDFVWVGSLLFCVEGEGG